MIKSKLIYLGILAGLVMFFILFIDNASLLILILAAIFPVMQLYFLFSISRKITATLTAENATVEKNVESKIIVNIVNKSIFPISCAVATLKITNTLTGEYQMLTTMMPVSADNNQSIKFSVSYAHCGKVIVTLRKIKIYDYVKLFSKTIFLDVSQEVIVLPSLTHISPEIETHLTGSSDNDEFSKSNPGDDCSEVFNVREYHYGDKINRIHWNLTTKLDELMVKEYSLPISSKIMILFEFCIDPADEAAFYKMDTVIETTMSLSYFMINNNISHTIRWYDKAHNMLQSMKITSTDDFSAFLGSVFSTGTYTDNFNAFMYSRIENTDMIFSHTIYVSSVISDEIFHNLSVLTNTRHSSYLFVNDLETLPDYFKNTDNTNAVSVNYKQLSEGLKNFTI
ncbi:MAG: DUF58 domain-containing protein [Oscillospiraceae bacterium]|nr:DUF58 domain-containing protein [Oscillospiraceae bacterium]